MSPAPAAPVNHLSLAVEVVVTNALPHAVVFDCDGTLADTETLSDRAWSATLADYGHEASGEDFRAVVGKPYASNFAYFAAKVDLGDPSVFRDRLRTRMVALMEAELELCDDAVDTLRELVAHDVPVAVASSSTRTHVDRVLARGDLTGLVSAIVAEGDVERHKPDPEPYLLAAKLLDVAPEDAVAVEDTSVGVASARAAGMYTVAVVRGHHAPHELAEADLVVDRITLDALLPPV